MNRNRRRALTLACLLAAALIVLPSGAAALSTRNPRLRGVRTWAFAIGDGQLDGDALGRLSRYDLVVLDGESTPASLVSSLQATGTIVVAYLSVGTIERERWWYAQARPYRLDYWGQWGEWYADVSKRGYRDVLVQRVAPRMLGGGFDGLFLDNTDMVGDHGGQARGMRYLVRDLSLLARRKGGIVITQNGADTAGPLLPYLDAWNREDVTWTYDPESRRYLRQPASEVRAARSELLAMRRAGLLPLATDYTNGDAAAAAECGINARGAGALSFVSDIGLSRLP